MKKVYIAIIILVLIGVGYYFFVYNKKVVLYIPQTQSMSDYVSYKSSEYSPSFVYPRTWGEVSIIEGRKTCPEEDTYRTSDTLNTYDWEYSFSDIKLPNSDSFIRTGIRIYELDPKDLNECGDDFLLKIANKEIYPEALSSVKFNSITNDNGLSGIFNSSASRLNTEGRTQYTFFVEKTFGVYYVIQPYFSFIPYFDSPELKEMEGEFGGDMNKYITLGKTSINIRKHLKDFQAVSESLNFKSEF